MTVYVFMGIAGSGKTTIGSATSEATGLPFIDADDLHTPLAMAKMKSGVGLTSHDRAKWGETIIDVVSAAQNTLWAQGVNLDILLACSALEMRFRKRLRAGLGGDVVFLHLTGDVRIHKRRIAERKGHFFKAEMLPAQFTALERPHRAIELDIAQPVHTQVEIVRRHIGA